MLTKARTKVNAALPLIVGISIALITFALIDWFFRLTLHLSKDTALYVSITLVVLVLAVLYRRWLHWHFGEASEGKGETN